MIKKRNHKTTKELRELFKSLGINTYMLKPYSEMYKNNTNTYMWGYQGSSMWYCTYDKCTKRIIINTKYFDTPDTVVKYNEKLKIK